jgi:hypothetical protein
MDVFNLLEAVGMVDYLKRCFFFHWTTQTMPPPHRSRASLCGPVHHVDQTRCPHGSRGERAARGAPLGPPEAVAADARQRGSAGRQPPGFPSQRKKLAIFDRPS